MHVLANEGQDGSRIVDQLKHIIDSNYVITKNIAAIKRDLTRLTKQPEFAALHNDDAIAKVLTQVLQQHDKHFTFQHYVHSDSTANPENKESWFSRLQRQNSGFKRVEILDGNLGYLDIRGFDNVTERSQQTLQSAMQFIAQTDAVIIDLRANGGGSAEMVQRISSYFLPADTHLNSFYHRPSQTQSEFRTKSSLKPHFDNTVPLYVLISADTFSAAEEFAYNLKHLKRATIIGEPSKGGANPWQWFSVSANFRAAIPVSMAINPITGTNWEGVGVRPHIQVEAKDALQRALTESLQWRAQNESNRFALGDIAKALSAACSE
jgi:C-terminal processing protease CtpA/Prc